MPQQKRGTTIRNLILRKRIVSFLRVEKEREEKEYPVRGRSHALLERRNVSQKNKGATKGMKGGRSIVVVDRQGKDVITCEPLTLFQKVQPCRSEKKKKRLSNLSQKIVPSVEELAKRENRCEGKAAYAETRSRIPSKAPCYLQIERDKKREAAAPVARKDGPPDYASPRKRDSLSLE